MGAPMVRRLVDAGHHVRVLGRTDEARAAITELGAVAVADVAEALGITTRTIEHLKERFVEEGIEAALVRKPAVKAPKLTFDGSFDARLTALACSPAPAYRPENTRSSRSLRSSNPCQRVLC